MADPQVQVTFGASTSQLEARIAVVRAQLASVTAQIRQTANAAVAAGTTLDAGLASQLQLLSSTAEGLKGHLSDLESEGSDTSAFASLGLSARQATMDIRALLDEFSSGRFRQGTGSIIHMLGQVAAANPVLAALAGGVALVGGALAYLIIQANQSTAALDNARAAMAFAGTLNQTAAATDDLIGKFQQLDGVTVEQAGAMQSTLGTIHNWSAGLQDVVTRVLPGFSASIGEDAPTALNKLAAALDDPTKNGARFIESLRNSTQAERDQFQAALATGNVNQENAAILAILASRNERYRQSVDGNASAMDLYAQSLAAVSGAESGVDVSMDVERQRLDDLQRSTEQNIDAINRRNAALAATPLTPAQVDLGVAGDVAKENPISAQIEQAQDKVNQLENDLKQIQIPANAIELGDRYEQTFKEISDSIAKAKQQLTDFEAQAKGGTPTQLTDLSQAQASVAAGQDDLRTAQAKVAALRQELSTATEATTQTRISTELAQAELSVREKIADISRANASQSRARAPSSDLSANLAEARANQAAVDQVYAAGSQQRIEAETQVLSAERAVSEQSLELARENANGKFEAQKSALEAQATAVKEAAQEHQISYQQELAELQANLAQQEGLERAHLEFLLSTYRDNVTEYAKTQAQLAALDSQTAKQSAQINKSVTDQIYQDYKKTFDSIGNSASSGIMGMIEGTESLGQAARKVLLDIIQQFIATRIQMVAQWLAGVAAQTTATVTSQTVQTAAVVTAQAAQTSAATSGGAARAAAAQVGVIPQLISDARAVFGGIFAFLAPVMGPAAAGPAAAGAAAVSAYATGAYNIDRNQLAMIHAGEMILPDRGGVASEFREFMSGGGFKGGAGSSGDTIHNHFAPTINASHNAGIKESELRGHARVISDIIKGEYKRGAFDGFSTRR